MKKYILISMLLAPFVLFSQSGNPVISETIGNCDTISVQKDTSNIVEYISYNEASFSGGPEELNKYIRESFQFPKSSINESPYGRAFVEITVEIDGSIKNAKILKGISEELDGELLRVVKNMPDWIPAENKYGKAKSIVRFPVNFRPY
ncbi:energy transducer TonB [Brumimicrobium mesophilum]|uniref:energy transducer TonB n=1 Tax=Brumimicrobium mesophilum TaxID=392717 RepID=UPI000D141135|nr:energy transducer TonB [Brumimicrobium mesophilum]